MAFNSNIVPGNPPLLWSSVEEAFAKVNENFDILVATIGDGSGLIPLDFNTLDTNVSPTTSGLYNLGSNSKRWKTVWTTELRINDAEVSSVGGAVNLPAGSTVAGELIRNPDETGFKTIKVEGQPDVVADSFQGEVNLIGVGIAITTDSELRTITLSNTGILSAVSGTGINVNEVGGEITITNTGVTEIIAGSGVSVNSGTGSVTVSNIGIIELESGGGITINVTDGKATLTNSAPNIQQNVFRDINVPGQTSLSPATPTSALNINSIGAGITITTTPASNSLTFTNTGVTSLSSDGSFNISAGTGDIEISLPDILVKDINGDLTGSVFADDSSVVIDGTNGFIYGRHIGELVGSVFADNSTTLVDGVSGRIVGPVENDVNDIKVFGGNSGEVISTDGSGNLSYIALPDIGNIRFNGNSITSDDSSGLVVVPLVNFNSDVVVENDLIVRNLLTVEGRIAGYISTVELKNIVAASADFDDFKARMAAL